MSLELIQKNTGDDESILGETETKFFAFDSLMLESGEVLSAVIIAYETYGELSVKKDNAILICHALSGDAHAAGVSRETGKLGWWDSMIGPGKAFDTNKYFIICSNVIGGCKGSTGPSSFHPVTEEIYALDFPIITIADMVNAQVKLVDHLGIERLLSVAGGSLGGMQVMEWMVSHPEKVRSAIPISTAARHSSQQIAFNEVGRQAIMADPNWMDGNYYGWTLPARGLGVARMIGHITYMSDVSMEEKFGRRFRENRQPFKFTADFEVEGYLHYRGRSFVKRFDANSYLYITKAMDYFDVSRGRPLEEVFRERIGNIPVRVMVIAFRSDWLYPAYQSQEIATACKLAGVDVSYCEIASTYGHDAFLVETEKETHLIRHFLENGRAEAAGSAYGI